MHYWQRAAILVILVFLLSGCAQPSPANSPDDHSQNIISDCQRISAPGVFQLQRDLIGASIEISSEAELAPPYTGDSSLDRTCIEITTSNVTLDCQGHTLSGPGIEDNGTAGIYIAGGEEPLSQINIKECDISAYQIGLYAGHLEGGKVEHTNAMRNSSIGFYIIGSSGLTLSKNTLVGNDPDGILILGSSNITVTNNLAYYNRMRGITFEGCDSCTVSANESHSHGVLGFAIYASKDMILENNIAHDNRYHGFAILHEAGSATFRGNSSYNNDSTGFYVEDSQNNQYLENESWGNTLDGIAIFGDSQPVKLDKNTLRDNDGFGVFSDSRLDNQTTSSNTFSGNQRGEISNLNHDEIDPCIYTGFGPQGECDPVFQGGPNLKDPEVNESSELAPAEQGENETVIIGARIEGDPLFFPSMGDLWMPTWSDDDRLFMSWGDGTGFGNGYPVGFPIYLENDTVSISSCTQEDYFPCWLWCNVTNCDPVQNYSPTALTDAGVMAFSGPLPEFEDAENISIDVPTGEPFFLSDSGGNLDITGRNDKPSSLLYYNGRLYFAGHSPAGFPVIGYLAYSEDYGRTWIEVPDSPWGESSNFRVLMFINMGQNYTLNQDGYVYAFGVGTEASWTERTVYLARVPKELIADYRAYEYFSGLENDEPEWSKVEAEATPLDSLHTTGQASAMYHEGTGRYLFLTTDANPPEGPMGSGALFEAPQPWGPWRKAAVLCFVPECNDGRYDTAWADGKYIAGLIPKNSGPDYVYFTIAGGDQHYQLQIGKLLLDIGP